MGLSRVRFCCVSHAVHTQDISAPILPPRRVTASAKICDALNEGTYSMLCGADDHSISASLSNMFGRAPHEASVEVGERCDV